MNTQRRGFPFFLVVLLAAAGAIVVAAALTTWWVLLALIPLTMMLGCAAMMTAGRMPCAPRANRGCCAAGSTSGEATPD
jgi:UPF0716 family protein affecting phage T7 exclusion